MKHLKRFNEDALNFDVEKAIEKIKEHFSEMKVAERFDDEILNWLEDDWQDEFETEYDWYMNYGHGEAEDVVVDEIIDWYEETENIKLDVDDRITLADRIKETYNFL